MVGSWGESCITHGADAATRKGAVLSLTSLAVQFSTVFNTRQRSSTSTRWHFAFGAVLS